MKRLGKHSLRPTTIVNIRVATTAEVNDGTGLHDIAAFPRLRHTRAATAARVTATEEIRRRRMPAWLQQGANTRAATAACVLHRIETQLNLRKKHVQLYQSKTQQRNGIPKVSDTRTATAAHAATLEECQSDTEHTSCNSCACRATSTSCLASKDKQKKQTTKNKKKGLAHSCRGGMSEAH